MLSVTSDGPTVKGIDDCMVVTVAVEFLSWSAESS